MSESTTSPTDLTSQYLAQVAGDLERNVKEQERITEEIAELQKQLSDLQNDHMVLVNMQRVLGDTQDAVQPDTGPGGTSVPAPRKTPAKSATSDKSVGSQRTSAKKDTAAPDPEPVRKPAGKKSPGTRASRKSQAKTAARKSTENTVAKTAQPTLVELVRRHLTEQGEPRSAAEVATALGQDHPERDIKTTVIRTTLEGLVAKNQAQRTKQGNSVFYTAPDTAETTQPQPQPEADPGPAE